MSGVSGITGLYKCRGSHLPYLYVLRSFHMSYWDLGQELPIIDTDAPAVYGISSLNYYARKISQIIIAPEVVKLIYIAISFI